MNKKYSIKIPLTLKESRGELNPIHLKFNINILLNPFYISESSLISIFVGEEDFEQYYPRAREIIFNASLRASEFTYNKLVGFSEEHKLLLRRELALCFSINSFSKHFYKGFELSNHRSKSFADFSVTTTIKNSPSILEDMIKSSNSCVIEAKKAIDDLSHLGSSLGLSNLKGSYNLSNAFSYRLWFHNNLPTKSNAIFASDKMWTQGNLYKDGVRYVSNTGINYNG